MVSDAASTPPTVVKVVHKAPYYVSGPTEVSYVLSDAQQIQLAILKRLENVQALLEVAHGLQVSDD